MKLPSNMHWPRVVVIAFLFVLATILAIFRIEMEQFVRLAFESGVIPVVVWVYVCVAVVSKNLLFGDGLRYEFDTYAGTIFNVATYGFAGNTSVTLLQGVYMQYFYHVRNFYNFDTLDLASIVLVSSYLLIYSGIATTRMLADVIFRARGTSAEGTVTEESQDSQN